jgi:hypothetical protein
MTFYHVSCQEAGESGKFRSLICNLHAGRQMNIVKNITKNEESEPQPRSKLWIIQHINYTADAHS